MVFHAHVCGDRLFGQLEYFQLVRSKELLLKLPWSSAKPADYCYSFFDPG